MASNKPVNTADTGIVCRAYMNNFNLNKPFYFCNNISRNHFIAFEGYSITTKGFEANNYNINFIDGTLSFPVIKIRQAKVKEGVLNLFWPDGGGKDYTWKIRYVDILLIYVVAVYNKIGRKIIFVNRLQYLIAC